MLIRIFDLKFIVTPWYLWDKEQPSAMDLKCIVSQLPLDELWHAYLYFFHQIMPELSSSFPAGEEHILAHPLKLSSGIPPFKKPLNIFQAGFVCLHHDLMLSHVSL